MFNFWWSAEWSEQKTSTEMQKKWRRPPKWLKNKMFIFELRSTSDDRLSDLSIKCWLKCKKRIRPLTSSKNKMFIFGLCSTSDDRPSNSSNKHWPKHKKKQKRPPKLSKNKMFIFGLCSTSGDWLGWLMDSNPICHPSPVKKIKCLFLDYIQLLMISWAGWWTRTPSTTPLQPKK